jgi:Carboxypeptidase regulatory-like domain
MPSDVSTARINFSAACSQRRRNFGMVPEGVLLGRVVDDSGAAVAGAQVMLAPVDRARAPLAPSSTQSGEEGRFQIAGLAPGRITIVARAERGSSTVVDPEYSRLCSSRFGEHRSREAPWRIAEGRLTRDRRSPGGDARGGIPRAA